MKKKILRILNRFNVGGPTYNVAFLTRYISNDFETKLIAGKKLDSEGSSEYILKEHTVDYEIIENMQRELSLVKDFKAFIEIRRIIREFKPDIVHTHASKSGALGRLAAISMNVPFILHTFHGHVFHSMFGKIKTNFYIYIERFLAKRSSAIVAISNQQKKELLHDFKICDEKKIHVIPLGFDLEKFNTNTEEKRLSFRNEFFISDDEIAIGIVGRLTGVKNHKLLLDSLKLTIPHISKKIKIFIVGDGEDRDDLISICKEYSFSFSTPENKKESLINFTSWRSDMDTVYAGLDIVVLSSLNEGTPVTLIEAQAAGRPVISTDVGGVKDIIKNNVTGLLAKSKNAIDFSEKLKIMIENDELRNSMGDKGYKNVFEEFSYKRLVADMESLYNQLLNE